MDITYTYPPGMLRRPDPEALTVSVMDHLRSTMHTMQGEVEAAKQPLRMGEAYDLVEGEREIAFVNDSGALFWSFVSGSKPHFPPWKDPDFVKWAEAAGIPAFLAAKVVSEHGTAPHPEIDSILEGYEERMGNDMVAGVDSWLASIW